MIIYNTCILKIQDSRLIIFDYITSNTKNILGKYLIKRVYIPYYIENGYKEEKACQGRRD